MIRLFVTGDGALFWSEAEALEHCAEVRDTHGDFISCECLNQQGIAENWKEWEEITREHRPQWA